MTKSLEPISPAKSLAKLKMLFGPPPVWGSEDPKAYDAMMAETLAALKPRDFIGEMLVKNLTDAIWEAKRYLRLKTLGVERQYREQQELYEESEEETDGEQLDESTPDDEKTEGADEPADDGAQVDQAEEAKEPGAPTTQAERMLELEHVVDLTLPDCQEIIHGPVDELEYAAAFQSEIAYSERVDRLYGIAMARVEDALKQFDFYEQGLGSRARRVADDIIDGEFRETTEEPVTIQGPDPGAQ
jgi:hypothetical protein